MWMEWPRECGKPAWKRGSQRRLVHREGEIGAPRLSRGTLEVMDTTAPLYRFEYFDSLRKRWVLARYRARLETIRERHAEFRLVGEPEVRCGDAGFLPPTNSRR